MQSSGTHTEAHSDRRSQEEVLHAMKVEGIFVEKAGVVSSALLMDGERVYANMDLTIFCTGILYIHIDGEGILVSNNTYQETSARCSEERRHTILCCDF